MSVFILMFWGSIGSIVVGTSIWLYSRRFNVSKWTKRIAQNLNLPWSDTTNSPPEEPQSTPYLIVRSPPPLVINIPQPTKKGSTFQTALLKMINVRIKYLEDAIWDQQSGRETKHNVKSLKQTLELLRRQKRNILGDSK
ncbi:MAG: hypothetical protein ACW976_02455 [Candidatus Ranarchaeia archaeon]|jgi:hypothetical protein